jgi:hypothetical protein
LSGGSSENVKPIGRWRGAPGLTHDIDDLDAQGRALVHEDQLVVGVRLFQWRLNSQ